SAGRPWSRLRGGGLLIRLRGRRGTGGRGALLPEARLDLGEATHDLRPPLGRLALADQLAERLRPLGRLRVGGEELLDGVRRAGVAAERVEEGRHGVRVVAGGDQVVEATRVRLALG